MIPKKDSKERFEYEIVDVEIHGRIISTIASHDSERNVGDSKVIDGSNKLLLPGFFNGHTHSSEVWCRGEISMSPLELWLAQLIDWTPNDEDHLRTGCLFV